MLVPRPRGKCRPCCAAPRQLVHAVVVRVICIVHQLLCTSINGMSWEEVRPGLLASSHLILALQRKVPQLDQGLGLFDGLPFSTLSYKWGESGSMDGGNVPSTCYPAPV